MALIVQTIGTTGRTYSTLALWEAGLPANLVTNGNSYEGDCYNDSEFTSASQLLHLTGHTTDSTHTITLTTGAGQSFRDHANKATNALYYNQANGVGISLTGDYATAVQVDDYFVTLKGLQIRGALGAGHSTALSQGSTDSVTYDDLIIVNDTVNSTILYGASTIMRNSLVVAAGNGLTLDFGASLYNCTIVKSVEGGSTGTGLLLAYGGPYTIKNCAVFGFGGFQSQSGGLTINWTTNYTDNTGGTVPVSGVTGGTTYANQFQSNAFASLDFRLKSGANLIDTGTTDSTNAATDIIGTPRPQGSSYDVGCWEFIVAAPIGVAQIFVST